MKTSIKILCALMLFSTTQLPAQVVPEYVNYQGLLEGRRWQPLGHRQLHH